MSENNEYCYFILKEKFIELDENHIYLCKFKKNVKTEFEDLLKKIKFSEDDCFSIEDIGMNHKRYKELLNGPFDRNSDYSYIEGDEINIDDLKKMVECEKCMMKIYKKEHYWDMGMYCFQCKCAV